MDEVNRWQKRPVFDCCMGQMTGAASTNKCMAVPGSKQPCTQIAAGIRGRHKYRSVNLGKPRLPEQHLCNLEAATSPCIGRWPKFFGLLLLEKPIEMGPTHK